MLLGDGMHTSHHVHVGVCKSLLYLLLYQDIMLHVRYEYSYWLLCHLGVLVQSLCTDSVLR